MQCINELVTQSAYTPPPAQDRCQAAFDCNAGAITWEIPGPDVTTMKIAIYALARLSEPD